MARCGSLTGAASAGEAGAISKAAHKAVKAVGEDIGKLAFNKAVPTKGPDGKIAKSYAGEDFRQIFLVDFPDTDGDGIAEGVK